MKKHATERLTFLPLTPFTWWIGGKDTTLEGDFAVPLHVGRDGLPLVRRRDEAGVVMAAAPRLMTTATQRRR
jgi:hypothetical protein